ncbi:MAG: hypothetical protein ACE5HJ_02400 [Thermoplasmata archaeon]
MPRCAYCGEEIEVGMEFYVETGDPSEQRTALTVACPDCAADFPDKFRPPPSRP